jgi:integrase
MRWRWASTSRGQWLIERALDDREVRLPVGLLYFFGQRIGDTVRMGPQNLVHGAIHVVQQKTGTALTIPVNSRLARIIEEDAPRGAMLFMLNERGKPMKEQALRLRLQKWARGARRRDRAARAPQERRQCAARSGLLDGRSRSDHRAEPTDDRTLCKTTG